ncbi:hypothetical protein ACFW04_007689 [Cataglyphis niger]
MGRKCSAKCLPLFCTPKIKKKILCKKLRLESCIINQVMEKGIDNEEQIEIYKEEGIYNENVEYCKDENNLVIENQCFLDKEKKVEVYEEEEKNTHTENIEYYNDMKDLIIDNSLSDKINNIPKNVPEGYSIVDLSYMWNEIQRTFNDHAREIECQFKYWQLKIYRYHN